MLNRDVLAAIARQMMSGTSVEWEGTRLPVKRTSASRLRTVAFEIDGRKYQAIEQNPDKPSRWGQLASKGHQVVQFKDVEANRFIGVSVDEKVRLYGQMHSRNNDDEQ